MSESDRHAPYCGYHHATLPAEDAELTRVGPGTPGGEFMRRFWHPVATVSDLGELPRRIRILGEELVLFRDGSGRTGLIQKHCPHRGASFEYGICEPRGIRCCYHGWLFDVDGTILETPAEPGDSPIRGRFRAGAYPVVEHDGILFAYLGPPAEKPPFPVFDTFEMPGVESVAYSLPYPCNWLQIVENAMDPFHGVFLHARVSGTHFFDTWARLGIVDFHERPIGFYYTNARRVGDHVWLRIHDILLPNFTQAGAVFATDGSRIKHFGRCSFTRWVVPVDDEHSKIVSWAHFGERAESPGMNTREGLERIEQGQPRGRSYEETQRAPCDYEAFIGQGSIARHANEHLGTTDRGVAMFRRKLREGIRALAAGRAPVQPSALGHPVPTYAGDSVVHAPPEAGRDDAALILDTSRRIAAAYESGDALHGAERDAHIQRKLAEL